MRNEIIEKIMEKSPYKYANKSFVEKIFGLIRANTNEEKIKLVRAKLRKISFSALPLKFYRKFKTLRFSTEIINMHRSTRERSSVYLWLIGRLRGENARVITDLGCGFNLIAFYYNGFIPEKYYGYEIDNAVVEFVRRFISEKNLNAKIESRDASETEFEDSDVCLCLKIFDALEDIERNITLKLLERIMRKTKLIVASFSKISLSGRGRLREREWFEKMLFSLGLKFTKETKGNEVFYFIKGSVKSEFFPIC